MWHKKRIFYHIYPLGLCGAPENNDGLLRNRIKKIEDWIPHMESLGTGALYLGPLFESDSHGYNTREYEKLDCRLGTNEDFSRLCMKLHEKDIKVVLDGVFNHVGRGFPAFRDVLKNRENSPYKDWFYLDFRKDGPCGDGFWYEGWEGHYDLVRLNLDNPRVTDYLFAAVKGWIEEFGIDGLRLDVAYMLSENFLRALRSFTKNLRPDFFLLGEMIHGDYNRIVNDAMLDSCTNYECYKGLHSSFNDRNFFEIAFSLNRQFGPEHWTLYKGKHLLNFADNHDVSRLASVLKNKRHLEAAYALLFAIPGIPCLYYGSEWGTEGDKNQGDGALRPCPEGPRENDLTRHIARLARIRTSSAALAEGGYRQIQVAQEQLVFLREREGEQVVVAVNMSEQEAEIPVGLSGFPARNLLTGETAVLGNRLRTAPCSAAYWEKIH